MSRFVLVLLFACTPTLAQNFSQSCQSPSFPDPQPKPIDSSCGVQGSGGAEANQNMAKNNFCAKDPAEPITFEKMNQLQQDVKSDGTIAFGDPDAPKPHGPQVSRAKLEHLGEGKLVVLKGFVKNARQEGAETVNCGKPPSGPADDPINHDIHISLVPTRQEANECNGVVVEMSPHHRPTDWTAANVKKLARYKNPVRVTGQLMFDSSHLPCSGGSPVRKNPARSSLWEVHPISKFEVCTADCDGAGQWEDLSDWFKQPPSRRGEN